MLIVLDIETLPDLRPGALEAIKATIKPPGNYSKAESIQKWLDENAEGEALVKWKKTALDGASGQLCAIGFAVEDEAPVVLVRDDDADQEVGLLFRFYEVMTRALADRNAHPASVRWCGHNVGFDLRFLWQRSVVHEVRPPLPLYPDARPWSEHINDTMHLWAGHGGTISLSALCRALGVPDPKAEGVDGSNVYDLWSFDRHDLIADYCRRDVEATRACYQRLAFMDAIGWNRPEAA